MKVELKDPRVPFRLKPEHEATIDRQVNEVVLAMDYGIFVQESSRIDAIVDGEVAKIGAKIVIASQGVLDEKTKVLVVNHDVIADLTKDEAVFEAGRRTPAQMADGKRAKIKAEAVAVLTKIHDKQMARRWAQWHTTCRMDGCEKQPRKGLKQIQHKGRKRTFVFCPRHAGIRNQIAKRDYQRLKQDANLRVVNA